MVDQWRRTERHAQSRGWAVDAVVATIALAGFVELVKTPVALGSWAEFLPSSAPALLAVVCALAGTRVIPLAAQIGLRPTRRSKRVAAFIAIRQLARRSADQRIFVLLTVSITLVVFGAAGWSVFRANQRNRALTELGASQVVKVSSARGVDPSAVVAKLDPSGRVASAVYVGGLSAFGIDALDATTTSPTLLVVDPRSFAAVAHWRAGFGSRDNLKDQLAPLGPAPPTLVPVDGKYLRMTATVHVQAVIAVRVHVGLTNGSGQLIDVNLGSIDPSRTATSTRTVHFQVPLSGCTGGCHFRRFALVPSRSDSTNPSASIVVTALDEVSATGGARSLLPALRATAWTSPDNVPGAETSVTVSRVGSGLTFNFAPRFVPVNPFAGYETNSNTPEIVPAIVSTSLLAPTTPRQLIVQPGSGLALAVRPTRIDILPRSGDAGVLISRAWLPASRPDGYDAFVANEVWLSPSAPRDFVDRLKVAGLSVNGVTTASTRAHRLAAQGARYSSDVLVFGAATCRDPGGRGLRLGFDGGLAPPAVRVGRASLTRRCARARAGLVAAGADRPYCHCVRPRSGRRFDRRRRGGQSTAGVHRQTAVSAAGPEPSRPALHPRGSRPRRRHRSLCRHRLRHPGAARVAEPPTRGPRMTRATPAAIRCERVMQIHRTRDVEVVTLSGIDLVVTPGELLGIVGPSGSGKSSLLALLGGLALPSAGRVEVLGQDMGRLSERQRLRMRAGGIGIMGQNPERNLLPHGNVLDNLNFAQRGRGDRRAGRTRRSRELLALMNLERHETSRITALSGGEQQRLALAAALASEPRLLLADEPTNQLDPASRDAVAALLRMTRDRTGITVVAVTHDPVFGASMDRSMAMRDGRLGTEHRVGESLGVVAHDGSIQLPLTFTNIYPPGSRVRYVPGPGYLEVHPASPMDREWAAAADAMLAAEPSAEQPDETRE